MNRFECRVCAVPCQMRTRAEEEGDSESDSPVACPVAEESDWYRIDYTTPMPATTHQCRKDKDDCPIRCEVSGAYPVMPTQCPYDGTREDWEAVFRDRNVREEYR